MADDGVRQVQLNIERMTRNIAEAVKEGLEDVTLDLERRAKEQAPIDLGDLRGSGASEVITTTNGVNGIVSFNTPYALIQHEDLTFFHPQGGKAKYLTDPLNQQAINYKKHIQNKIRRVTR